ncbi:MAG: hypothetical protein Q8O87_04435 [bacterium]|nr:hypothetical protein [bacterium]
MGDQQDDELEDVCGCNCPCCLTCPSCNPDLEDDDSLDDDGFDDVSELEAPADPEDDGGDCKPDG